jgi:hypothetical protein
MTATAMADGRASFRRGALALAVVVVSGCAAPGPPSSPEPSQDPSVAANASPLASDPPTPEPSAIESPLPTAAPTESPPPSPTDEPEPTPDDVFPPRTEIEINSNVVDRPGVPKAVRDEYWWTFHGADVGLLGTTAQLGVPSDEEILDASDGLVVSVRRTPNEPGGSEIIVRAFETGSTVRTIQTKMGWLNARVVGRRLFWAGLAPAAPCQDPYFDGGVWTAELDGGEPIAIVEPGKALASCMSGRQVLVSPSGETIGAVLSSYYAPDNWIDVIDASSLSHYRLREVWPDAMTDDTFVQWDNPPTDGIAPGTGFSAYDLGNGAARWRFPGGADEQHFGPSRFLAYGSRFYVEYTWNTNTGDDTVLATFDPHTGQRSELVRQVDTDYDDVLQIQADSSTASHVVLEAYVYSERPRPRTVAIVDVDAAQVDWAAFTIDPPWLCYPNRCIRD